MTGTAGPWERGIVRGKAVGQLVQILIRSQISRKVALSGAQKKIFYRALWIEAAFNLHLTVRELPDGELVIGPAGRPIRIRGQHCLIDGDATQRQTMDKPAVSKALHQAGLPVARQLTFSIRSLDAAVRFIDDAIGACVIKPAWGGGGDGVTTQVRSRHDLRRAVAVAAASAATDLLAGRYRGVVPAFAKLGKVPLVIEDQHQGYEFRLLYLDGVLVDALRREPPSIVGDGHSPVGVLIDRLNVGRLAGDGRSAQALLTRDLELRRSLAAQGLTMNSVPPTGSRVRLKTVINENSLADNHPAAAELCEAVVEAGALATATVGARFAGVDIITPDPGLPLADCGGCIIEVNIPPNLAMHYHGRPGSVAPATVLLRRLSYLDGPGSA